MADYDSLHPEFSPRLLELQRLLRQEGLDTTVGSGLRTPQEQSRLYAQGRTAPGPIVTGAPAGSSYHNYGAAADIIPRGMDEATAAHLVGRLIRENPELGLTWGGKFSNLYDPFHVQLGVPIGQTRGGRSGLPEFAESREAAPFGGAARPGSVPDVIPQMAGAPQTSGAATSVPAQAASVTTGPSTRAQEHPAASPQPWQYQDFFKGPLGRGTIDFGALVNRANRYG